MICKNLCGEVSKIKNLRCTFSLFFHADHHEMILIYHILLFLAAKWPRKWAIFLFFIISWFLKISQHVLQISLWWIFKNKNLRCTFSSFFHADRHEIILICRILLFLPGNWPRKWSIFINFNFVFCFENLLTHFA